MDRSIKYTNGMWSIPNLRPTRAQTAASAYRGPRLVSNKNPAESKHYSIGRRPRTTERYVSRKSLRDRAHRSDSTTHLRPLTSSASASSFRRQSFDGNDFGADYDMDLLEDTLEHDLGTDSGDSAMESMSTIEENAYLRQRVKELERSLISQHKSNRPISTRKPAISTSPMHKTIRVRPSKSSFDPSCASHPPIESLPIETPAEIWRPSIAPRPLSPVRQMGRIESYSRKSSRSSSQSSTSSSVGSPKNGSQKSETKHKADKSGGTWSLGRAFQPKEMVAFELNSHLLDEWLNSYNDEQRSYRSLSTKIETELHEAQVFASHLPKPNMLVTAVAITSLDRLGQVFGRYKGLLHRIREILIGSIYEDSEKILAKEQNRQGRTLKVEEFSKCMPYFTALQHHKIQLADVEVHMGELRQLIQQQQKHEKRRSSRMVAEMWKNAAVKSTAKNTHSLLARRLKETEDSLQNLHSSLHADAYGSTMKMIDRLNRRETVSVLQSLIPLLGAGEMGMLLAQILRDAKGFKSSDALHLIEGLTQKLIPTDQVALFPNCNTLLPNSTAYQGTLALLKSMKPADRDALIGELFHSLENGPEALVGLLQHLLMEGEHLDAVQLMTCLSEYVFGKDGGKDALLQLAGNLMKTAIKRGQQRGGRGDNSPEMVLGSLFEHLPSEVEHTIHHQSHKRRVEKGITLEHENENNNAEREAGLGGGGGASGLQQRGSRPNTNGISIECQTEDAEGLFGSLQEAANRPLASHGSSNLENGSKLEKTLLTHWYEDLLMLGGKRRYANIAPMNYSKAQSLVYDTLVRKITKNAVDDRTGKSRESMGSFLRNSFKKLYGIPRVVNENLVGVVRSLELFSGRSRRVRIFGELCGRNQKEHISDRLSDVYLNILTLTWPKFSKAILRSKSEGDCFINSTQIRKVLMGVFPKSRPVPPKPGKMRPGEKIYLPGEEHYFIGKTLLNGEVRNELYETIARTVFESEGVTWVDFDVFAEVCLEAWKRQTNLNADYFALLYTENADQIDAQLGKKGSVSSIEMNSEESLDPISDQIEDVMGSAIKVNEEQEEPEKIMTQDGLEKVLVETVPGIEKEKCDEMWKYLEKYRLSEGMTTTITKEHFIILMVHYGIVPPASHFDLAVKNEYDSASMENEGKEPDDPHTTDDNTVKSTASKLFGSLGIAIRLKKIAHRIHGQVAELPHFSLLCQTGQVDEVRAHIEDADLDERSDRGSTPVMHATWFGHSEVVAILINNGANINLQNNRGNTALHFAYENDHKDIVRLLVGSGAVELKNAIGIAPQSLQKKFDRRNSMILQNLADEDISTAQDEED